jgi:hypothetical protein
MLAWDKTNPERTEHRMEAGTPRHSLRAEAGFDLLPQSCCVELPLFCEP